MSGIRYRGFALATALGAAAVLSATALLGISAYLIGRASQQPPILSLTLCIVVVRTLALAGPLARYGERLVGHDLAFRSLGRLRVAVFERIEPLAPGELEAYRDGELLGRLVGDVDEIQDLVLRIGLPIAVATVCVPVIVVAEAVLLPVAGVISLLGLLAALLAAPAVAHRCTARAQARQGALRTELTAELVDGLAAAEELWLCGADGDAQDRIADIDRRLVQAARADARGAGWSDAITTMLAGATSIAILAVAAAAVPAGALDPLLVAPLALMAMVAFEVVQPIGNAARSATSVLAAAQRIVELAEHEPPVSDGAHPHAPLRPRPEIRLHDVSVERGVGAARTRVVDGLDLSLAPGERIVVTGASGAGKSTLLLVLARFLERARGDALLDEHDLRSYAQRDVRREVTLLQQDPHVFDSTLRANVALARPGCTDDEIHGALARAQLSDFVASLPAGLDTRVGASGRTLSGGQRQRLAVARAFLAGGSVLLVDEPTAHLDAATAEALLRDLWSDVGHRSVVLVSHGDPGPFGAARVAVLHRPPPVTRSAARTVGDQRYWSRP